MVLVLVGCFQKSTDMGTVQGEGEMEEEREEGDLLATRCVLLKTEAPQHPRATKQTEYQCGIRCVSVIKSPCCSLLPRDER